MLAEPLSTQTPPLYSCYCRRGEQAFVPITGNRQKRILHGCLTVHRGDALLLFISREWGQETHQAFLRLIRVPWRGWRIILFEARGTPHKPEESLEMAAQLDIEVRLLPRATPELNAMAHLWRAGKGRALADRPTRSIDSSADAACRYLLEMRRRERLTKAGVLSGNFWLTK